MSVRIFPQTETKLEKQSFNNQIILRIEHQHTDCIMLGIYFSVYYDKYSFYLKCSTELHNFLKNVGKRL